MAYFIALGFHGDYNYFMVISWIFTLFMAKHGTSYRIKHKRIIGLAKLCMKFSKVRNIPVEYGFLANLSLQRQHKLPTMKLTTNKLVLKCNNKHAKFYCQGYGAWGHL